MQKNFYKLAKHGFATTSLSKKIVHGVGIYWLSDQEKVPLAAASKEGHAVTVFYWMKVPLTWFP